jgi:predicted DNA-binding transcriptional regulator AlpA
MITARFFCESCKKETDFLPVSTAIRMVAICRSTIYNWMDRGWIHWSELPSGRRIICQQSLLAHHQAPAALSAKGHSNGR